METNTNAQKLATLSRTKWTKTLRPWGRMKQQHCASEETNGSNKMRKKMHLLDQTTTNVGNKEEMFPCKGSQQNKGTTLLLAGEELENNTLKRNMNHFGEPGLGSDGGENNMN